VGPLDACCVCKWGQQLASGCCFCERDRDSSPARVVASCPRLDFSLKRQLGTKSNLKIKQNLGKTGLQLHLQISSTHSEQTVRPARCHLGPKCSTPRSRFQPAQSRVSSLCFDLGFSFGFSFRAELRASERAGRVAGWRAEGWTG